MSSGTSCWVSSPLSWLSLCVSVAVAMELPFANIRTVGGTETMVLHSVRCALVFFLVAFTASSLALFWPSPLTRWLLRNRRAFGLTFAIGMAWHLLFVAWFFVKFHRNLNSLALGVDLAGLAFLIALTVTSFGSVAKYLSPRAWQRLHRTGVYAIWSLTTYLYLLDMKYNRDGLHVAALAILLCAALLRAAAWRLGRRRDHRLSKNPS